MTTAQTRRIVKLLLVVSVAVIVTGTSTMAETEGGETAKADRAGTVLGPPIDPGPAATADPTGHGGRPAHMDAAGASTVAAEATLTG